jgi:alpha-glucosidase
VTIDSAPTDPGTPTIGTETDPVGTRTADEWWRSAVIYQIYPRSFADSDGDGIGDLPGITSRLTDLADLGIDAIWLSPFYLSPQNDAGYDVADYTDVDPLFGTLADFDTMLHRAHELELKVIVDLVPNHSSDEHVWFKEALAAPEGSPERARYIFRDGRGENGELPPNNWESVFGGDAWTRVTNPDGSPGQWYLHLFDKSQPDFDWNNTWVHEQFVDVLRFWLDRGVDGFRVDVAHGMVKAEGLPDWRASSDAGSMGGAGGVPLTPGIESSAESDAASAPASPPYWAQEGVHEIFRDWRRVLDEYEGDRVLVAEAWVDPLSKLALWVREDEMDQAFNFTYLETDWSAPALRKVISDSLESFGSVGAPSTWVLSNHDVVRHASRLALTAPNPQGAGVGPNSIGQPIPELGLRRARAATTLMLGLPGSAYLYQGEELGLPEVVDLPDEARQDPTFARTNGEKYGRDGCRVPIPWDSLAPAFGFNKTGASWLPQPTQWADFARDRQRGVIGSTLELYRTALFERDASALGTGSLTWLHDFGPDVVAYENRGITVIANLGEVPVELPVADLVLSSEPLDGGTLPPETTVWLRTS